ncbi:hypothetical protein OF829_00465 [Sphingomonas sp. LB-2]|uniref:hypothetical protein n=1 Tax=Sphingomonas caeni TaxID=2984949 RepID=UPI0022310368|nr:hypothetical protein [Sphingomonas caeni]MCW3845693.1 hypothetical protein [Sphingomonas caeni]
MHIGFGPNWTLTVNHASFPGKLDKPARVARAVEIFETKFSKPGGGSYEFQDPTMGGYGPYPWQKTYHQPHRNVDSTTFDDLLFANRTEIFIFIEHPQVVLFPKEKMLVPTTFASDGTTKTDSNESFFGAEHVTDAELKGLLGKGKMMRLENYVAKANGSKIKTPPEKYSLNIGFTIPSGLGPMMVVVDPDTGNGMGYEP